MGIDEEEYEKDRKGRKTKTLKALQDKLETYREWLLQLTICDPACGSGAFLNQALEFLIAEHKLIDELQTKLLGGELVLPNVENTILENNLFGVDINNESVEIAKLSLWLRTAKHGRKLTTLNDNIKCGNSLIDDPEVAGVKAFNWKSEFPEVFAKGGFDVVIGNPPYGILLDKELQPYYKEHFPLTQYKTNLYILFIERMFQIFDKGVIHFIIPKSLLFNTYYEDIRRFLLEKAEINEIYTITEKVFEDAEVGSSLLLKFTLTNNKVDDNRIRLATAHKIENFISQSGLIEDNSTQHSFLSIPNCEISIVDSTYKSILQKLKKLKGIRSYYKLKNGLNPGNIKHILIDQKKLSEFHKPIVWGKEISKYFIKWGGDFVNYNEDITDSISIDDIKSKEGMNKQNKIDFALRTPDLFEDKKIVVRKTGDSLICSLDDNNYYFDTLVHGIYQLDNKYKLEPLIAIMNTKIATVFYRLLHDIKGKVFAKISLDNLGSFPIPEGLNKNQEILTSKVENMTSFKQAHEKIRYDFISLLESKFTLPKLSKKLLNWFSLDFKVFLQELKKQKIKLSLSEEAEWMQYFEEQKAKALDIQQQMDQTDREIDQMVYELYGLTEEEIRIVEEATN